MGSNRKPSDKEKRLLELLIQKANINLPSDWKSNILVRAMNDEEMGSLLLFPQEEILEDRELGKQVSEYQFKDNDGVDVIASLNTDKEGNLFELDIWKTDFSPLVSLPKL